MICRQLLISLALVSSGIFVWSPVSAAPQEKLMNVNDTKLSYVDEGAGTPVVFVHGAVSDLRVWDAYRSKIAENRRFIAYTQRYFGTEIWPDKADHFSRETHIDDLIGFVEGLEAGPVHLVTWSYSGEIATYAALKRPDLFRSMVHFEPVVLALLAGLPGATVAGVEMSKNFGPAISALKDGKNEDAALRLIEVVFKLPEGAGANEPEPWPTYWRQNGRTVPPLFAMAKGAPITCGELGAIQIPTLVVQGRNTFARYSMISERLAGCQANALLLTMQDVNHDGPYRKPDEFAALIENFLGLLD